MNENTRQGRTDIKSTGVAACLGLMIVLLVFKWLVV